MVKLCLDYKVKKGKRLVKKELIVALKGELYFVKFIINPEEDDFEPGVILGRSFLRLANGVLDLGNGVNTIYPELDPFEDDSEKTGKCSDDSDQLLDFNFDDVPKFGEELLPFICKTGKSNRNKKRTMENLNLSYQHIKPSSSAGGHLTQEEVEKEALAVRISQKDKVELDGKTIKEEEDAVKRIKGEALKEKDDPSVFIFPIRLEGKVNKNALANIGKGAGTQKESQICCGQFISKLDRKCRVLTKDVVRSLSALIYCRDMDTTMLKDLIDYDGKLILEDPQPGVPRVGIPRPLRASMPDLYDRMGRIKIC
nr:hypothetical protein [Tanacetum cinerariifolium]